MGACIQFTHHDGPDSKKNLHFASPLFFSFIEWDLKWVRKTLFGWWHPPSNGQKLFSWRTDEKTTFCAFFRISPQLMNRRTRKLDSQRLKPFKTFSSVTLTQGDRLISGIFGTRWLKEAYNFVKRHWHQSLPIIKMIFLPSTPPPQNFHSSSVPSIKKVCKKSVYDFRAATFLDIFELITKLISNTASKAFEGIVKLLRVWRVVAVGWTLWS